MDLGFGVVGLRLSVVGLGLWVLGLSKDVADVRVPGVPSIGGCLFLLGGCVSFLDLGFL